VDQPEVHEYLGSWRDVIEGHGLKEKKKMCGIVALLLKG